jgi:hypothetical protein
MLFSLVSVAMLLNVAAVNATELRRPISPSSPMWLIHIDTWNSPDPERIIEMVPEDIRPFVCFNISLSATDATCCSGPDVCDSWLKACAEKRVWCMIQPASGSHNRFSDTDFSCYEKYFKQYPNFIGWNFAEQFWGFGDTGQPTFDQRLNTFVHILDYCQQYGGYLVVSFTQAYFSSHMMPIAYMRSNVQLRNRLTEHPENFICCEKYTMSTDFFDIESNCVGAYLGGYAGQLGIRFDACGWSATDANKYPFVKAAGAIPIMAHVMLDGETVIDGPETIPVECSRETARTTTKDGYTRRNWGWFPHFVNINIDEFRKIVDGTVRIMTRKELIDRSKVVIVNNGATSYHTPEDLYDGVCRQACDNWGRGAGKPHKRPLEQRWWFKKSGRYPCIPQTYALLDDDAKQVEKSITWANYQTLYGYDDASVTAAVAQARIQKKLDMLDTYYPEEYTGDIYASHHENCWMTYNPYQYDETYDKSTDTRTLTWATSRARGAVPCLYNTCDSICLSYAPYSMGVMKEFADHVDFYLTNYRNSKSGDTYTEKANECDTLRICGVTGTPQVEWKDRGAHRRSTVTQKLADSVLTITVWHNGPLDIAVSCSGKATGRRADYTEATIVEPELPPLYADTLQHEAEFFDYKDITACRTNAYYNGHAGYQGQGFVEMGSRTTAVIRDTLQMTAKGTARVRIRYQAPDGGTLTFAVNTASQTMALDATGAWKEAEAEINVVQGVNQIKIAQASTKNVFVDCVKVFDYPTPTVDGIGDALTDRIYGSDAYYNLSGQRVNRTYKGLVIRRGKKVMQK